MSEQLTDIKDPLRTMTLIAYGLFISGLFLGGLPSVIGVILAYIKRKEAEGSIYGDHFNYLIKTFWVGLIGSLLGFITSFLGIGFIILMLVGLWYLIRLVYGVVKALDRKEVNPASWLL